MATVWERSGACSRARFSYSPAARAGGGTPGADAGDGAGRPTLIVNGHTDVVPAVAGGWSHDPFDPVRR